MLQIAIQNVITFCGLYNAGECFTTIWKYSCRVNSNVYDIASTLERATPFLIKLCSRMYPKWRQSVIYFSSIALKHRFCIGYFSIARWRYFFCLVTFFGLVATCIDNFTVFSWKPKVWKLNKLTFAFIKLIQFKFHKYMVNILDYLPNTRTTQIKIKYFHLSKPIDNK